MVKESLQLWSGPRAGADPLPGGDGCPRAGHTGSEPWWHRQGPTPSLAKHQRSSASELSAFTGPAAARHLHSQSQMGAQDKIANDDLEGLAWPEGGVASSCSKEQEGGLVLSRSTGVSPSDHRAGGRCVYLLAVAYVPTPRGSAEPGLRPIIYTCCSSKPATCWSSLAAGSRFPLLQATCRRGFCQPSAGSARTTGTQGTGLPGLPGGLHARPGRSRAPGRAAGWLRVVDPTASMCRCRGAPAGGRWVDGADAKRARTCCELQEQPLHHPPPVEVLADVFVTAGNFEAGTAPWGRAGPALRCAASRCGRTAWTRDGCCTCCAWQAPASCAGWRWCTTCVCTQATAAAALAQGASHGWSHSPCPGQGL